MDVHSTIRAIRDAKLAIARIDPRAGMPVLPPVGATERALVAVERKLRRALPPSYRAFLSLHDGWPQFLHGAGLLGVRQLTRGTYVDLARLMLGTLAEDEIQAARSLVPFGIDSKAETIFAFDTSSANDELDVVVLVNDIGVRFPSFFDFLGFAYDVHAAEL